MFLSSLFFCFFVLLRLCNRDFVTRRLHGIVCCHHLAAQVEVTMVTCWSHDCLKFEHVLFRKLTSEVIQLKNIIYNNKKFFSHFSTNINFFLNYFLRSIQGTPTYHSQQPKAQFSVLWWRREREQNWRVLLTKGVPVPNVSCLSK